MFVDSRKVKDLKAIFGLLHSLDKDTDGRYSQEIIAFGDPIQTFIKKLEAEADLRRKLESYTAFNFDMREVLRKRYSSPSEMKKEISALIKELEDVKQIMIEYDKIKNDLTQNERTTFEALLRQPLKSDFIKQMWKKLKR